MKFICYLTLTLCLALSTSLASAGVNPWTEDFEADFNEATWTTESTSVTEMLSNEYNHTADAGSSRSLLVQNIPGQREVRRYLELGFPGNQAVLETWFYDEGATVTGFQVGVWQESFNGEINTTSTLTIGTSDLLENENTEYVLQLDDITTPTGVARSIGWHKVEFGIKNLESVTVRLDDISLAEHDQKDLIGPTQLITLSHPSDVGVDAPNRVWIDDLQVYIGTLPETDVENWLQY